MVSWLVGSFTELATRWHNVLSVLFLKLAPQFYNIQSRANNCTRIRDVVCHHNMKSPITHTPNTHRWVQAELPISRTFFCTRPCVLTFLNVCLFIYYLIYSPCIIMHLILLECVFVAYFNTILFKNTISKNQGPRPFIWSRTGIFVTYNVY